MLPHHGAQGELLGARSEPAQEDCAGLARILYRRLSTGSPIVQTSAVFYLRENSGAHNHFQPEVFPKFPQTLSGYETQAQLSKEFLRILDEPGSSLRCELRFLPVPRYKRVFPSAMTAGRLTNLLADRLKPAHNAFFIVAKRLRRCRGSRTLRMWKEPVLNENAIAYLLFTSGRH